MDVYPPVFYYVFRTCCSIAEKEQCYVLREDAKKQRLVSENGVVRYRSTDPSCVGMTIRMFRSTKEFVVNSRLLSTKS